MHPMLFGGLDDGDILLLDPFYISCLISGDMRWVDLFIWHNISAYAVSIPRPFIYRIWGPGQVSNSWGGNPDGIPM